MTKKDRHYLEHLTDKSNEKIISEAEKKLLADFVKHEYDHAEWDSTQMGAKGLVAATIYNNIKKSGTLKKPFRNYYKYAAAAAIAIILGLGILIRPQKDQLKDLVITTAAVTDSLRLQDGTLVYLAANSTFKYPAHFSGKTRSVALLKGNAFFKVAKDQSRPFVVTSAQIKTKVLGTSFHISLDHHKSSVTVITGRVSVYANQQVAFLDQNENASFTPSTGLKKQSVKDVSLYSWYKKDITLNDVTLCKVFTLLNFKYGVNFNSADKKILNTRMTLFIKDGLPLQNVIDQINYITHLKLRSYGNTIDVNY